MKSMLALVVMLAGMPVFAGQSLQAAGVPVQLRTHWLQGHVLAAILPGSTLRDATRFLQARLSGPAPAVPQP